MQIFATTHSPFVVAGLKAGQVHLLNRDANGVVTASTNTENIEGWTADEILRVYMGVHEPTDELTAQAARDSCVGYGIKDHNGGRKRSRRKSDKRKYVGCAKSLTVPNFQGHGPRRTRVF